MTSCLLAPSFIHSSLPSQRKQKQTNNQNTHAHPQESVRVSTYLTSRSAKQLNNVIDAFHWRYKSWLTLFTNFHTFYRSIEIFLLLSQWYVSNCVVQGLLSSDSLLHFHTIFICEQYSFTIRSVYVNSTVLPYDLCMWTVQFYHGFIVSFMRLRVDLHACHG